MMPVQSHKGSMRKLRHLSLQVSKERGKETAAHKRCHEHHWDHRSSGLVSRTTRLDYGTHSDSRYTQSGYGNRMPHVVTAEQLYLLLARQLQEQSIGINQTSFWYSSSGFDGVGRGWERCRHRCSVRHVELDW
jgi:hypothetical protein